MAMAAIGLSKNLRDIKNMGYKPFVVGLKYVKWQLLGSLYYNYRIISKLF